MEHINQLTRQGDRVEAGSPFLGHLPYFGDTDRWFNSNITCGIEAWGGLRRFRTIAEGNIQVYANATC